MSGAMKPSGYEAIGLIPEEWEVMRLHVVADLFGRIGWQGLTSDEYTDEGAYLITGTDFKKGGIDWDSCVHVSERRWEEAHQIKVRNGDLLITKDGTVGKLAIVSGLKDHASLNSGLMRIVPKGQRPYSVKYLYYVLSSEVFHVWYENITSGASTIKHLFQGDFYHFVFPFPCENEQQEIADHLDAETARMDDALDLLQQQVKTLEAYKRSLIQEAVTKGLDPNAPMKPSGVDWIGDIPVGWECKRLKYAASFGSGTTPDANNFNYYDGDVPWIQSGDLYRKSTLEKTEKLVTVKALLDCSALQIYKQPFVVVAMYGASVGNTSLSRIDACMNQACCCIKPTGTQSVPFFYYAVSCAQEDLIGKALGGTQPNISQVILKNESVPIPPSSEQQEIAEYLDSKCIVIDKALAAKREQIDILQKQRQSIIYEYVTGKRRVSEGV